MTNNVQKNLYPYLYLFITDISQIPLIKEFSNYEQQEPGYAIPYLNAYRYAFQQKVADPISSEFFIKVNAIATAHLTHTKLGAYRDDTGSFEVSCERLVDANHTQAVWVTTYSMTEKGLEEFIEYWLLNKKTREYHAITFEPKMGLEKKSGFFLSYIASSEALIWGEVKSNGQRIHTPFNKKIHLSIIHALCRDYAYKIVINPMPNIENPASHTQRQMDILTAKYNREIKLASSNDDKILVIARYIQHVEQLHPFNDGNIRTCTIILNKLLRDNKLPLTILYNPNMLDCCDIDTVVTMIKEGQKFYLQILANENPKEILLDARSTPWIQRYTHIRCEASYAIEQETLEGFAQDVLTVPKISKITNGMFTPNKQPIANELILDLLPIFAANFSGKCCEIRDAIECFNFNVALRRACAFGEYDIANKMLDLIAELEINLEECSSNGKNALAWLESSSIDKGKQKLAARLNSMMCQDVALQEDSVEVMTLDDTPLEVGFGCTIS